jgi:hypothetical protein
VSAIEADVFQEGKRLLARAEAEGVPLRLLGGVAIRLRAPGELPPAFARTYADLDFVTVRRGGGPVAAFFRAEGYEPHVAFNALHGQERLLFFDTEHDRQVDVFIGQFSMSHRIPFEGRLELEPGTVPLAELLLTKLQIAQLNEKDVRDALALLHGHPVGEEDGDCVNARRVAELCCDDWGLWRTFTGNLDTCCEYAADYELTAEERAELLSRIEALVQRIEREPKTRRWKLRAKVGERKRWYDLPEEVGAGP